VKVKSPYHGQNKNEEKLKICSTPTVLSRLTNCMARDLSYVVDRHLASKEVPRF
jgi:hypothetical protein